MGPPFFTGCRLPARIRPCRMRRKAAPGEQPMARPKKPDRTYLVLGYLVLGAAPREKRLSHARSRKITPWASPSLL